MYPFDNCVTIDKDITAYTGKFNKKNKKKLQGKSMNKSILDSWNILYLFYICIYTFIYIYVNTFCVAKI